MNDSKRKGLNSFIHSDSSDSILSAYQQDRPFYCEDLSSSISDLTQIPFLKSLDTMLDNWSDEVHVHLPDAADEASAIKTNSKEARKLFRNGMGVRFSEVNKKSPKLDSWLQNIKEDFGFSKMTYARSIVYATPANKGNAPHFDQNYNIVIQLTGNKKWWIAPNTTVANPLTRHVIGLETDPELASYTRQEFPKEMPEGAQEFTLKAGSVLFVPRGHWHMTHANEDSLALNLTFSAPTYLDTLTAALRGRLAQSPHWRESIDGLNSEEGFHIAAHKFNLLLAELKEDVKTWEAEGILAATEFAE